MVIKKFAKLCNCNPQTIRYYDSIDLLKPVRVDEYTGYRYYNAEQALQYLRIKKLQEASFSIDEIKNLLNASDEEIVNALEAKIKKKEEELHEIEKIKKSYQKEMKDMRNRIDRLKEKLLKSAAEVDFKQEFGIDEDEFFKIINIANEILELSLESENINIMEECEDEEFVADDSWKLICEIENYDTIKDAMKKIPKLKKGKYLFYVASNENYKNNFAFISVLLEQIRKVCPKNCYVELYFEPNGEHYIEIYKKEE